MKRRNIVGFTRVWMALLLLGPGAGAAWAQEPLRIREVTTTPTGIEITGPDAWRLLDELKRRVNSASPEELRALVESLLASLPSG